MNEEIISIYKYSQEALSFLVTDCQRPVAYRVHLSDPAIPIELRVQLTAAGAGTTGTALVVVERSGAFQCENCGELVPKGEEMTDPLDGSLLCSDCADGRAGRRLDHDDLE